MLPSVVKESRHFGASFFQRHQRLISAGYRLEWKRPVPQGVLTFHVFRWEGLGESVTCEILSREVGTYHLCDLPRVGDSYQCVRYPLHTGVT